MEKRNIEVCYSPALFPAYQVSSEHIVVIVDILRATTAITAAFDNGVKSIIPVASPKQAEEYKKQGFLVAAERDGIKLPFADFGNSPFNFQTEQVVGQTIAYSTTNGTQAIEMAKEAKKIAIAAFTNLSAMSGWIKKETGNVMILCAGWKNRFNLEDSVFAGALAEKLLEENDLFSTDDDATKASITLWKSAKNDLLQFAETTSHRHRLKEYMLDDVLPFCFSIDTSSSVPIINNGRIIAHNTKI
ncbi:MAG: 2-phosphosulfolactate phosphatase [Bacteroidetes bacterium]|nr:2-phosphosulfolactate phosphatase [Bacteroidota bacterium]MBU1720848.1 2-phosphosulfolactate phosphatase [Bacteroidota bacterium]